MVEVSSFRGRRMTATVWNDEPSSETAISNFSGKAIQAPMEDMKVVPT